MLAEDVTGSLREFLVAYIHAVAYVCQVYPQSSFSLKSIYGLGSYECNHPGVRLWVENAVNAVMQLIYSLTETNKQATVSIVILEDSEPRERFGISVARFELTSKHSQQLSQSSSSESHVKVSASEVAESFSSCFARLYASIKPTAFAVKGNRSMTVFFEGELGNTDVSSTWMRSQSQLHESSQRIQPIRSIEIGEEGNTVLVLNAFRQRAG